MIQNLNNNAIECAKMALVLHDNTLRSLQEFKREASRKKTFVMNQALQAWPKILELRIQEQMAYIDEVCREIDVQHILKEIYTA